MSELGATSNRFDLLREEFDAPAKKTAAPAAGAQKTKGQQQAAAKPTAAGGATPKGAKSAPAGAVGGAGRSNAPRGAGRAEGERGGPRRNGEQGGNRPPRQGEAAGPRGGPRPEGARDGPGRGQGDRQDRPRRQDQPRGGEGGAVTVDGEPRRYRNDRPRNDRRDRPLKDRGDANAPGVEGRGRGRGGKRVFERHSGTGRDPTENIKGGSGKSNWGVAGKDDFAAEIEAGKEVDAEPSDKDAAEAAPTDAAAPADGTADSATDTKGKGHRESEEQEPEDNTLTLEEYQKKLQKDKAALKKIKLPPRRVIEADPNAIPLKRDDEESAAPAKPKKEAKKEQKEGPAQPKKKKEETISAADLLRFDTGRRRDNEGGFRGGRGGGRGGARGEGRGGARGEGRGGARGEGRGGRVPRREGEQGQAPSKRASVAAPAIGDAQQFPALGQ